MNPGRRTGRTAALLTSLALSQACLPDPATPPAEVSGAPRRPSTDLLDALPRQPEEIGTEIRLAAAAPLGSPIQAAADIPCGVPLSLGYGVLASTRPRTTRLRVEHLREGRTTTLFETTLQLPGEGVGWHDAQVPPSVSCGEGVIRLVSSVDEEGPPPDPSTTDRRNWPSTVLWSHLAPVEADEQLVVLFLQDTLRADAVGAYGSPRPTTPHLDRLARAGTLFARAIATSSWTRASVGSIFTSRLPYEHGAMDRLDVLPVGALSLAEVLAAGAMRTEAIVANGNIGYARLKFHQGFDRWNLVEPSVGSSKTRGERLVPALRAALPRGPWPRRLLYVHAVDPHAPYAPLPPYAGLWDDVDGAVVDGSIDFVCGVYAPTSPRDVERLRALYDEEVMYGDHQFGLLLALLAARGAAVPANVLFVSDHGEAFGEHQVWQHGASILDVETHVPLVAAGPAFSPGAVQSATVSLLDLAPTVLAIFGEPVPREFSGGPLPPLRGAAPAPVVATHRLDGVEAISLEKSPRKAVISLSPMARLRVSDIEQDPGEHHHLGPDFSLVSPLRDLVIGRRPGLALVVDPPVPGDEIVLLGRRPKAILACMGCDVRLHPDGPSAVLLPGRSPAVVVLREPVPAPMVLELRRDGRAITRERIEEPCRGPWPRTLGGNRVTLVCREPPAAAETADLSDAERDALRAIGYLQ